MRTDPEIGHVSAPFNHPMWARFARRNMKNQGAPPAGVRVFDEPRRTIYHRRYRKLWHDRLDPVFDRLGPHPWRNSAVASARVADAIDQKSATRIREGTDLFCDFRLGLICGGVRRVVKLGACLSFELQRLIQLRVGYEIDFGERPVFDRGQHGAKIFPAARTLVNDRGIGRIPSRPANPCASVRPIGAFRYNPIGGKFREVWQMTAGIVYKRRMALLKRMSGKAHGKSMHKVALTEITSDLLVDPASFAGRGIPKLKEDSDTAHDVNRLIDAGLVEIAHFGNERMVSSVAVIESPAFLVTEEGSRAVRDMGKSWWSKAIDKQPITFLQVLLTVLQILWTIGFSAVVWYRTRPR